MNQNKKLIVAFLFIFQLVLANMSIYDIQYTTIAGENNYYPSLYNGQTVETGGIVSGVDYSGKNYFITSSAGGAWSGLYIYDNSHTPEIGDSIILKGNVYEYNGITELKNIQTYETISTGNLIVNIPKISTQEVSTEAFESCIIEISDLSVTQGFNSWSDWRVNDGSGECLMSTGFFNLENSGFSIETGESIAKISGIISFAYGEFRLNPRTIDDILFDESGFIVSIQSNDIYDINEITIPVEISSSLPTANITNYQLNVHYNPAVVAYTGFENIGSLSQAGSINENFDNHNIQLDFEGAFTLTNTEPLIYLNFDITSGGDAEIIIDSCKINNTSDAYPSSGMIYIVQNDPIGDTLTVIQKPILNVPEIVTPGETMDIICIADENTSNWDVELIYKNNILKLPLNSSSYNNESDQWLLNVSIPDPQLYELYDLHVTASGNIDDITENAVNLIENERDNYYFVHITDTHLPSHTFFADNVYEALNDTSELQDLRDVINDINIINPEFVLHTGDLINEGELEDFMNGRVFTKSQKLLTELEVPFFLVGGNHDLGGWDDTPPSQGTSRRDWWRFFGWKWLQNGEKHTQDYTFSYGKTTYIGMEAYDNYDRYMFNIYGDNSFTRSQMNWLQNELDNAAEFSTKVLFYHNDFSNQINLTSLKVEMALYGHIHRNYGSENTTPYNLATSSVCDGQRAYRIVKVENNRLRPYPTINVNNGNETIDITYSPSNNGSSNTITATVSNHHDIDFENARVKFIMPKNNDNYEVSRGKITQLDQSEEFDICYVEFNLPANTELSITINSTVATGLKEIQTPDNFLTCYPNPFNSSTTIEYSVNQHSPVELSIYNVNGQKIKTLVKETKDKGNYRIAWRGDSDNSNIVSAGVYFYEIISENFSARKQMVFLK